MHTLPDGRYRTTYCGRHYYYRTYLYFMDREGEVYKVPRTPIGHTWTDYLGEPLPEGVRLCMRRKTSRGWRFEVI